MTSAMNWRRRITSIRDISNPPRRRMGEGCERQYARQNRSGYANTIAGQANGQGRARRSAGDAQGRAGHDRARQGREE